MIGEIEMPVMVERHGDMGRGVKLRLRTDGDGDVHVVCDGVDTMTGKPAVVSVEFCTARGGGRSPRVREALRDLIHIIAAENEENPWPPNVEFSGGAPLHGAASAGTQGYASEDEK